MDNDYDMKVMLKWYVYADDHWAIKQGHIMHDAAQILQPKTKRISLE